MTVAASAPTPAVPVSPSVDAAKIAQAPPSSPKEDSNTVRVRAHQRALKVKAKLEEGEGADEPEAKLEPKQKPSTARAPTQTEESKPEPKEPAEAKPAEDAESKRRAERHERIRKAQERERAEAKARASDPRRRQETSRQATPPDFEARMKRLEELEARDKLWDDEMAILEEAERRGRPAEKLAQAIRTQLTDPGALARHQVKTEADKIRAEWQKERDEIRQEREAIRQERERAAEEQQLRQKTVSFIGRTRDSEETHPLSHKFHARHGDKGLVAFANQFIAPLLRPDYSDQELHDHIEQFLDEVQFAQAQAAAPGNTANGTSHPPKNGAEQPQTTLSNRLASERVSVTEEKPLHLMPRRERVAKLKAKLGGD